MAKNKWDKHIKLLEAAKANPEKVFNLLSTVYGKKKNLGSTYQSLRSSWPIDVCYNIYNKTGTTNKNKKISLKQTIRNWVNTEDYMIAYRMFHPGPGNPQWEHHDMEKLNLYKNLPIEKHVRNCNDIWISAKGKKLRQQLKDGNGKYIFKKLGDYNIVDTKKINK